MEARRHLEFHERQDGAMQELMAALLPVIPTSWRHARLELEVSYSSFTQTRAIRHRLTNPSTHDEVSHFTERLFAAATALHVVFSEYEQAWKQAVIELTDYANGAFRQRKANYTYET